MRIQPVRPTLVLILACSLALLLFLLDLADPQEHFWGRYLLPIVLVFLWGRRRDIYIVTAFASVFVAATNLIEPSASTGDLLVNHLAPAFILWAVAWLLVQRRQLQERLARHEQALDQLVKERTAALAAREQQLAKIFRANPGGISITRQSDGCFLEANDAFLAMVGYTREELIGHTLVELGITTPENRAEVAAAIPVKGSLSEVDLQLTTARGEPIVALGSFEELDFGGEPCYLGLIVDITRHKQMEKALRQSEQKWHSVFEFLPVGLGVVDSEGRVTDTNPALAQILDIAVDESCQNVYRRRRYFHADMSPMSPAEFPGYRALREQQVIRDVTIGAEKENGEIVWVSVSATPESIDGYAVSVFVDISELKRYQQLLQAANADLEARVAARTADLETALADLQVANQLKDEFLAVVSHELRTPLTGVLSLAQVLEQHIAGPLNDRQTAYLRGIVASGERLLHVVNGILSYTHVLSGKFELHPEPYSVGGLLEICAASQQHKAAAKEQSITVCVKPPDLTVNGDAIAVAEVLKRLLENAVKFTPAGGQIGLEARLTGDSAAREIGDGPSSSTLPEGVEFVVWDTGIGIAAGQFDHILKPFTQSDASLARGHEGLGLGLAYVDQMVRLMGGTLAIESMPRVGSRFTVTLPA